VSALAVRRVPAARAAVVAADFDDPWLSRVSARHPVKTIAAKIENSAAVFEIAVECIKALAGPVFGMRSGDDSRVTVEQRPALPLEILVRRNVIVEPNVLEPFDDIHIDREVPVRAREPVRKAGAYVEERPPTARIAHRCSIAMGVVT
jgi:hypothetical protein